MPSLDIGESDELLFRLAEDNGVDAVIPRHKCQVGVRHFVADEPLSVLEPPVQDAEHPFQLVVVSLNG